ncbi:MAG: serine acetyltransferase [Nitrospirae bacterium]|nr:serine acetyltransferase [Nitrospirota bacterium]
MFENIKEDIRHKCLWYYDKTTPETILRTLLTDGTLAMFLYRSAQFFKRKNMGILAGFLSRFNAILTGALIGRNAKFGKGFVIIHSIGVVINSGVTGGNNILIEHCVTIGAEKKRAPRLGNNIFIGAGAKIIGEVNIGNNVKIGANAVVVDDVPDNVTVVGVPARVVKINGKKVEAVGL